MANLLLAAVAFVAMKVLVGGGWLEFSSHPSLAQLVEAPGAEGYRTPLGALAMGLSVMLNLNVLLGVFNLLPLPPLDGSRILTAFLPSFWRPVLAPLERYGVFLLFLLILIGGSLGASVISSIYGPVYRLLMRIFFGE